MKIILEFDSQEEHDAYVRTNQPIQIHGEETTFDPDTKIPVLSRNKRRPWTQYEMQVVQMHYATKSVRWIAASLKRTPAAVQMLINKMRKAGADLPLKRRRNGEVREE